MKKTNEKIKTDRCSEDDIANINRQKLYLAEHYISNLEQENQKYKEVIDKAIEYIKETKLKEFEKSYGKRYGKTFTQAEVIVCNMILNKMQELQGSRE